MEAPVISEQKKNTIRELTFRGFSVRQIAEAINCTHATIAREYMKARRQM